VEEVLTGCVCHTDSGWFESFEETGVHRTCVLGLAQTLPDWRYLPVQEQCMGVFFTAPERHTNRCAWKGWALSVPRLSTVSKGRRVQR